ncbi:Ferritin, mitochondrial Flags: Precursor [Candidatus Protochlamydia naegleriophila]|uniref:Ferritin n=1 Tax=Candidatus Protochlamydia naegleriophila TaxID=389348 RepID=A0A0U5JA47_9BACT|nr:ferritin [Candidatus Protochlamydia naegleriophila]CUI16680.1 Ferritin, mitochondrial Flags: Precursor [Candidatus Protochlamydia naegleriophila]
MNDKIYKALNEQIKHEFYSSYLYLSIASYFENIPLDGFGKWFRKQAEEEQEHAMKIYNYIIDRNLHVDLQAIDKPTTKFNSIEEAFQMALEHERKVTHWIHQIYELAVQEKDHATHVFLQWFITEQVEEEKNAQDNLDLIQFNGDNKAGLLILDQNFDKKAS